METLQLTKQQREFFERLERNRPAELRRIERAMQAAKEFRKQLEGTAYLLRLAAWKFCEAQYLKREGKP